MMMVGTSEGGWLYQDGGSFSIGLRCYLMTVLVFGLVEASGMITDAKGFYILVTGY